MSNNLDKSLDEIIGKKPVRAPRDNKKGPKKASKQINGNRRQGANNGRPNRPGRVPVKAVSRILSNQLIKVNVEGLPRDIKQNAVRVCSSFQVEVCIS